MGWHHMAFDELSVHKEQAAKPETPLVLVYLIEKRPDGTLGIGNSHECPRSEAKSLIEAEEAKHPEHPIGIVPPDWQQQRAKDAQ